MDSGTKFPTWLDHVLVRQPLQLLTSSDVPALSYPLCQIHSVTLHRVSFERANISDLEALARFNSESEQGAPSRRLRKLTVSPRILGSPWLSFRDSWVLVLLQKLSHLFLFPGCFRGPGVSTVGFVLQRCGSLPGCVSSVLGPLPGWFVLLFIEDTLLGPAGHHTIDDISLGTPPQGGLGAPSLSELDNSQNSFLTVRSKLKPDFKPRTPVAGQRVCRQASGSASHTAHAIRVRCNPSAMTALSLRLTEQVAPA